MKVRVESASINGLQVEGWYADKPNTVVDTLKRQLEAAAAIWPELAKVKLTDKRVQKT